MNKGNIKWLLEEIKKTKEVIEYYEDRAFENKKILEIQLSILNELKQKGEGNNGKQEKYNS